MTNLISLQRYLFLVILPRKNSRKYFAIQFFLCNFALGISKITTMDKNSEKYDLKEFEGEGFVSECLEEFDANVAKVEAE